MSVARLGLTSTTSQPAAAPGGKVTPGRILNSEWIKFRTLRSSWLTLLGAVVAMVGTGLIIGYVTSTSDWATLDGEQTFASATVRGYLLTQLIVGVLGVLFVTGEYGTGMIRSTFAAVPQRLHVLAAKTVVFSTVALVSMTLASFAAFFGGQIFLSADDHGSSLSDPGALRAIAGVGVYLMLVGALGGALGWIVRSTAGSITALVALLLIVPVLVGFERPGRRRAGAVDRSRRPRPLGRPGAFRRSGAAAPARRLTLSLIHRPDHMEQPSCERVAPAVATVLPTEQACSRASPMRCSCIARR